MKVAYAIVVGDGTLTENQGIKRVEHRSTGRYWVHYEYQSEIPPGVTATPWEAGPIFLDLGIDALNQVAVTVRDLNGEPVDAGFSILAVWS